MVFIDPLDLETIFVDLFSGSALIFLFVALVVIAILAARFKMPGGVTVTILVMFSVILSGTFVAGGILQGILLIIVTGGSYMIAKSLGRGLG